jgi:hypothetical protein
MCYFFYVPLAYILHLLESCRFSKGTVSVFPGDFEFSGIVCNKNSQVTKFPMGTKFPWYKGLRYNVPKLQYSQFTKFPGTKFTSYKFSWLQNSLFNFSQELNVCYVFKSHQLHYSLATFACYQNYKLRKDCVYNVYLLWTETNLLYVTWSN